MVHQQPPKSVKVETRNLGNDDGVDGTLSDQMPGDPPCEVGGDALGPLPAVPEQDEVEQDVLVVVDVVADGLAGVLVLDVDGNVLEVDILLLLGLADDSVNLLLPSLLVQLWV